MPLPFERDEAAGQTAGPSDVIQQAQQDIESGQVDTDMHNLPGPDAERREEMVSTQRPQTSGGFADKHVGPGSHPKAPATDRPASSQPR